MNRFGNKDHTFVVCAYKESRYLAECIESLMKQTVTTKIVVSTSTPNEHIRRCAAAYDIPVFVKDGAPGISGDWNFAVSCADTRLITIAHQDDLYEPRYAETMLRKMNRSGNPILFFSGYYELKDGIRNSNSRLIRIKKLLAVPAVLLPGSIRARRLGLAFGNYICCPSVTYSAEIIKSNPFADGLKSNLDWQQWEKLSKLKGEFVSTREPLMSHRIHDESESSILISENNRTDEDYEMFRMFWPEKIAKKLAGIYSASEKSYKL